MKKRFCKILNLCLVLSLMAHIFMPLTALAQVADIVLTFTVEDPNAYTLALGTGDKGIQVNNVGREGGDFIEVLSEGANITNEATYNCSSTSTCTATITNRTSVSLRYHYEGLDLTYGNPEAVTNESTVFTTNTTLTIKAPANQHNDPVQPGPDGPQFDGKAYLIWSCKNGGVCYKHFDDIPNFDDGNSTFYPASGVKSETNNEVFDVNAKYKFFSTDAKFDAWVTAYKAYKGISTINWSQVDPKDIIGEPVDMRQYEEEAETSGDCTKEGNTREEFELCVNNFAATKKGVWVARAQLQPVGEPTYNNSYVSYGDRNFKVVIYNDNYKGVSIGSLDDLSYYPAEWANPFIKRDQYDISGTSKDKPTGIDAILLEKTVNIKVMDYNGFEIVKLEALDVPAKAVDIQKVDDEWRLTFASNFYDKVVFKATDRDGKEYYFMIKRYTIDGWIKNVDNKPVLNADFYFDNRNKYSDFELSAKIIFKDGTEKNVKLEAVKGIDDGMGNITDAYEVDEEHPADPSVPRGKGLKKACFQYNLTEEENKNIKKIYLNAEFKGSTNTNYAGAYTGSGEGILANIYTGEE